MSDITKLKEHAARRLRNTLEGSGFLPILQGQAFYRCGVGLREEDFEEVIQELIAQKYLARDVTRRGKFVLRKHVE
jgi:hypothetical protein